jgi:hypothetical protein
VAWVSQSKDSKCAITALNQASRPSTIGIDLGYKSSTQSLCITLFIFHFDNASIGCDIKFKGLNSQVVY